MPTPKSSMARLARPIRLLVRLPIRFLQAPLRLKRRFGDLLRETEAVGHRLDRAADDRRGEQADVVGMKGELASLAERMARLAEATPDATTLLALAGVNPPPRSDLVVSVVLPTWQRADVVAEAVQSVVAQTHQLWELVIVDDGSSDHTKEVLGRFFIDPRIHYQRIDHSGTAAARNHGIDASTGDVVVFLDSDSTWHPTHLARLVHALETSPSAVWAMSGQVILDGVTGKLTPRPDRRALETLMEGNFIDLNAVAVRRSALTGVGGFDESLTRLIDWDFVLRLAGAGAPARTESFTSVYRVDRPDRISVREPIGLQGYAIRARHRGQPAAGLKVLFAEWHFPQLTETYIAAMLHGLQANGAEVEVWSESEVAVAYPSPVPVRRGTLEAAIGDFGPDVVVSHWINKAEEFRATTGSMGVTHVARVHGFEFVPDTITRLLDDGVVVHTFPHLVDPAWAGHPRLVVEPTCFDDDRYRPSLDKDPRLVVRTAAGLLTKDLDTFLMAANLCPEHRFVLVLGHALLVEERTEMVIERARELGSRAEILVDLQHDQVADLLGGAAIYLHTHGTDHPVSMPISIAESMATGCWVLGRDLPGMSRYLQPAGTLYGGATSEERAANAAALISASASWSPDRWRAVWQRSSEQAFERYAARDVTARMLASWRHRFPHLPAAQRRESRGSVG